MDNRSSEILSRHLILFLNFLVLLFCEIVLQVQVLSDVVDGLVLDVGGHFSGGEVEKGWDVEVIGSHQQIEKLILTDVDKVGVPLVDKLREVIILKRLLKECIFVVTRVLQEFNNFLQSLWSDIL